MDYADKYLLADDTTTASKLQASITDSPASISVATQAAKKLEDVIVKIVEKLGNVGLGGLSAEERGIAHGVAKNDTQGKARRKAKEKSAQYVPYW